MLQYKIKRFLKRELLFFREIFKFEMLSLKNWTSICSSRIILWWIHPLPWGWWGAMFCNEQVMLLSSKRNGGGGQRSLVCCSPGGRKEWDTIEWLNWTKLKRTYWEFIISNMKHWVLVRISEKFQGEKQLALRWKNNQVVEHISILHLTSHLNLLPMSKSCWAHLPTGGENIELGKTAILWASKVVEMLINAVPVTLHHFPRVFVICTLRHSDSHLAVAFRQVVMEYISTAFNIFSFQLHAVNQTLAMVKCDWNPPQSQEPLENPAPISASGYVQCLPLHVKSS